MIQPKRTCFLLLFLLAGCRDRGKIDLHDYSLPTGDLLEGKVYCFVDSTGAYKLFEWVQETVSGSDTLLDAVDYDSSFTEKTEKKDRLTRSGITPLSTETFQNGSRMSAQFDSILISWVHPLHPGDPSVHERFTFKSAGRNRAAAMDAGYDSVTDKSLLGLYRPQDCIQENQLIYITTEGSFSRANKPFWKLTQCLCKGLGRIGYRDAQGRMRLLKMILSQKQFDSLRKQH
jgi:hypothetical protein